MIFTIDGESKSQIGGGLPANQSHDDCVQVGSLAVGSHSLGVTVDPDRAIPESNEGNNVLARNYVRRVIDDIVGPWAVASWNPRSHRWFKVARRICR